MLHIETGPVPSIEMVTSVAALCDIRLRNWIKQNRIELVNFHDALYATDEYQNHLRLIGSDLYMHRKAYASENLFKKPLRAVCNIV